MPLALWSHAEYTLGIIAGSIPPCRSLVLQIVRKVRGEAPPSEDIYGVPKSPSGRYYTPKSLARITNGFSRSRASPGASESSRGSKNLQKSYTPLRPWNREANRTVSHDSGRESILPLHNLPKSNLKSGILKTVDVRVKRTTEDDSGQEANHSVQ